MNILADTHVLLWALSDDKSLSKMAKDFLVNPNNNIFYSSISVWEVEIKHKKNPSSVIINGKQFAEACRDAGFIPIAFNEVHAGLCETLDYPDHLPIHKDPFDKALIAQAKADSYMLMTHDEKICAYNEPCVLRV